MSALYWLSSFLNEALLVGFKSMQYVIHVVSWKEKEIKILLLPPVLPTENILEVKFQLPFSTKLQLQSWLIIWLRMKTCLQISRLLV